METTLVLIKPDGVQRSLIGEIIYRYERVGLKLVALKLVQPTATLVEKHYLTDPDWLRKVGEKSIAGFKSKGQTPPSEDPLVVGKKVLGRLVKYLTSGPIVASVWSGANVVSLIRKITGGTEPLTSDVGTIRGDFVLDSYKLADDHDRCVRNLVHASGTAEEAGKEIALWFQPVEILAYNLISESILYDVNLDGILE